MAHASALLDNDSLAQTENRGHHLIDEIDTDLDVDVAAG